MYLYTTILIGIRIIHQIPRIMASTKAFQKRSLTILLIGALTMHGTPHSALSFDWVPTDEEIKKYRQSWNPFSEGPLLIQ